MKLSQLPRCLTLCTVVISMASASVSAEIWMTAPQLCAGKAYSSGAREALWTYDSEQRVSLATEVSPTMYASVHPGAHASFVVNLRVRLADKSQCRLTLDKTTYDLTQTQLQVDDKTYTFEKTADARGMTHLKIRRYDDQLTVEVDGKRAFDPEESTRAFERIGLQAVRGKIAVTQFSLTGQLVKQQ